MTDNIVFLAGFVVLALACALILGRALADLARRLPAEDPEDAIWRQAARERAGIGHSAASARDGVAPAAASARSRRISSSSA
ncbi:MAG: hypothetical protein IE927_08785 [Rhodobacterales bacterium]|nr:hypothetical protein [Rhodobacterales bacterium]